MDKGMIDFLVESGSFNIGFWIVIVLIVFGLIFWLLWWVYKKKVLYVFNFGIIDVNGRIISKKARRIRDDKGVFKFEIESYSQQLDVRDPNAILDGVPTRLVSWDGMGHLVYTDKIDYEFLNSNHKFRVAKVEYLETALKPVEREQVATAIIDATKKHSETPSFMKWVFWLGLFLLITIVVGMFVQGKLLAESYKKNGEALGAMFSLGKSIETATLTIKENTEIQKIVLEQTLNLTGKTRNVVLETK